jgi:hypothetical protein
MVARDNPGATAKRRHPDVEAYLARLPLPARALSSELRKLVHATVKDARETIYYGVPFFFVDDVWFCYVSAAKKHVTFGFTMGDRIADPSGRLVGTGKSPIRKVALGLDEPVPAQARGWVEQAAALAREAA